MLIESIREKVENARQGREIWLSIEKECALTEDSYVILFPQKDTLCNSYVLKHLSEFAHRAKAGKIVLLSYDEKVLDADAAVLGEAADTELICRFFSREAAEKVMDYYMLQMFTDKLVIAALDEPEGRNGRNVIGINGITEEEAVAVGILGLSV